MTSSDIKATSKDTADSIMQANARGNLSRFEVGQKPSFFHTYCIMKRPTQNSETTSNEAAAMPRSRNERLATVNEAASRMA
jgi:hypothetical protein